MNELNLIKEKVLDAQSAELKRIGRKLNRKISHALFQIVEEENFELLELLSKSDRERFLNKYINISTKRFIDVTIDTEVDDMLSEESVQNLLDYGLDKLVRNSLKE